MNSLDLTKCLLSCSVMLIGIECLESGIKSRSI